MQTIYLYLSDPAPALLDSIRQVMKETKIDLRPVIFSHSSAWVNATNPTSISVPYSQWNLSGLIIPPLTHETPIFAPLGNWHVHYGAQMAATYDCQLRAMANGFRWVAQLDLDEYIVPVLPNKIPWSGSITSPIFLRQLGKEANARKPLGALRSKPTLSHYYEFRSTFVRSDHGPVSPPPDEIVPKGMTAERIFHPDMYVLGICCPIRTDEESLLQSCATTLFIQHSTRSHLSHARPKQVHLRPMGNALPQHPSLEPTAFCLPQV